MHIKKLKIIKRKMRKKKLLEDQTRKKDNSERNQELKRL